MAEKKVTKKKSNSTKMSSVDTNIKPFPTKASKSSNTLGKAAVKSALTTAAKAVTAATVKATEVISSVLSENKLSPLTNEDNPEISVVIPMFNEQENIDNLCNRLLKTMDEYGHSYEVIFVDDGSSDRTPQMLQEWFAKRSDVIRVITFNGNYGQYVAILAGFENIRGETIVTLDADLQNLPEEIPMLLNKMQEGYDLVGGYRKERHDNFFRTYASKIINIIRYKATGIKMVDHGCMLRAYKRHIIDEVVKTRETSTFITALAQRFAWHPIDVPVSHEERNAGDSKYSLYKLIRITFDLLTGFSLLPLQLFTMFGMTISGASLIYFFVEVFKKVVGHHHGYGLHFAFLFLLLSVIILGIGLLGEYLGRAYFAVCEHPSFVIRDILEKKNKNKEEGDK